MDTLLLVARLVLCVVLLAAAFGKFADLPGSRQAMLGFGLPANLAPVAGIALPFVELIVGLGLLPVATAWWAALATLVLMLVFIGGIAWNMSQGRAPDCHCFGQLHSEPAGPKTLVRNGLLALIAAFVVVAGWGDPGVSIGGWVSDRSGFELVMLLASLAMLVAIGVLGWLVLQLMSQAGRLIERLDTIEGRLGVASLDATTNDSSVGSQAPEFTLPDLSGEQISLTALRASGRQVLLFFTNPGCEPCGRVLAQIPAWQERAGKRMDLVVISRGTAAANEEKAHEHGLGRVLLQDGREVNKSFGVDSTPSAVLVNSDGTIASSVAAGANAVNALVEQHLSGTVPAPTPPPPAGFAVGQAVPPMSLSTLEGTTFAGLPTDRESVLLFWSPTCGFCQRMVPELKAWEERRPVDAPELVIVSIGNPDAIRAHGFTSTVLLDGGTGTSGTFGSRGTPAAVRIDSSGNITAPIVHGASAVLALLNTPAPLNSDA